MVNLFKNLIFTSLAALILSSCGKSEFGDFNPEVFDSTELTGGTSPKNSRVYTRASNGSDKALSAAKAASNPKSVSDKILTSRVVSVDIGPDTDAVPENMTIRVSLENPNDEFIFSGEAPTSNKVVVDLKALNSQSTLKVFCSTTECQTYVGVLKADGASTSFTMRNVTAKARLLFLNQASTLELLDKFLLTHPLLPIFIEKFTASTAVSAFASEISMGRSIFKIELAINSNQKICLEGELQNTDLTGQPLPQVNITCGTHFLPFQSLKLIGNTQNGQVAIRFEIPDTENYFDLFVDFNGKNIEPAKKPLLQPDLSVNPRMAPAINNNAFISINLQKPRTSLINEQFSRDFPPLEFPIKNSSALTFTPEETYGHQITQKWIQRWQGNKISIPHCFRRDSAEINYKPSLVRFFKASKVYFEKIKNQFETLDVPANFFFTTLVESPRFFKPTPIIEVSSSGAVGPWQFMRATGRERGLKTFALVNGEADTRDERGDFMKASTAAINYFDFLLKYFIKADYKLAFAAYNNGAGGIYSYIRNIVSVDKYDAFFKQNFKNKPLVKKPDLAHERINNKFGNLKTSKGDDWWDLAEKWGEQSPDYWFLHEFHMMSCETREYVPKLISAMMINEDPKKFGF